MMLYFWVMLGSALGGGARYWCSGFAAHHFGYAFPAGTLLVNVAGSFIIGLFATLTEPDGRIFLSTEARQFVMVGLCGGYTTFSSFSLQTLTLIREGEAALAGVNVGLSFALCMIAVWLGHISAAAINQFMGG